MRVQGNQRGATLLDTLIGIALMLLVFVGITAVFRLSVDVVTNNKARTGALALAQERMEYIRALSYSDIGTSGGIPSGDLEQEEEVSLNGVSYTRKTLVRYIDDPKDGEGIADENDITADSKEVKVTVSWEVKSGTRSTALTSRVSPPGIEQAVPGGTLSIFVVDADVVPVPSAVVSIVNNSVSPLVSVDVLTNEDGEATFIGVPEGVGYEIAVSKVGQSTAQTYDADAENTNPDPGHLTVVDSATTESTFAIDSLASLTVETHIVSGTTTVPVENIDFNIRGNKTIGADGLENPIYKYDADVNSGGSGVFSDSAIEWDVYTMSIDGSATGYDIMESCETQPVFVEPASSNTVRLVLAPHTAHSLLVDVKDEAGSTLEDASVRLYRGVYDETEDTSSCGQTFFSGLSEGTVLGGNAYSLDVTLAGYEPFSSLDDVDASGASRFSVVLEEI